MNTEERRAAIVCALREQVGPVSASALAARFGVSRQIIVGDVALLRAKDVPIFATPRGYLLEQEGPSCIRRTIACCHSGEDPLAEELFTVVDFGGEVVDVIVEHPIYGQISGQLHIQSRFDVQRFLEKLKTEQAKALSSLTGGIHLHTISCPSEEIYERILQSLSGKDILLPNGD